MDTKKLDKWADLLLDTGKRNNLINFRDTSASTVEVLFPASDALFRKIDEAATFEVFDPKIPPEDDLKETAARRQLQIEYPGAYDGRAAYLSQYSSKIKRQNQILLYNGAANPLAALKNINKKARGFIEETGVNVAYMAFGFIHWKESNSSNYVFRAPILLVPIQLEQESAVKPYYIKPTEDDIIVNPTFAYKMDAEHGVKLPDYDDEGLTAYLEKINGIAAKLQWTVSSECKIGIFSFLKINMYRDLKDNAAAILANPNIRQLLGESVDAKCFDNNDIDAVSVSNPLIELHVDTAISQNVEAKDIVNSFKKLFYYQWIDSILAATPALSVFNRISQDKAVRTFAEKDIEQFEINKAKIRAELSDKRPSLDMIVSGSALATLLREGEKKRKQKSIRSLLAETGELVQCVKPCFLMSPLSVSTFLASDCVHFDVVIFDEASQIFPQDAAGAIYRAEQLIVVGDSKQMPPSNFFNASIETEDDNEETEDVTDFESILDLCSASMPQLRLRWHYRSRYEQLITFSNKNFYDGELITFPSSKADSPGIGVDYYHVNGVFDRKTHTNLKEAEFVVDLVYQNIEEYPNRSLGVVAFSAAQQDLIENLLSKRRQSASEKEFFFKGNEKELFLLKILRRYKAMNGIRSYSASHTESTRKGVCCTTLGR